MFNYLKCFHTNIRYSYITLCISCIYLLFGKRVERERKHIRTINYMISHLHHIQFFKYFVTYKVFTCMLLLETKKNTFDKILSKNFRWTINFFFFMILNSCNLFQEPVLKKQQYSLKEHRIFNTRTERQLTNNDI